ncbi:hypothetical protein K4F52_002841 [Lecanicillium sp. MT-2017a]|nr:hypothetical protein K4F52_002841 [Lecanicillium sp. MT-2017a]
MKDHEAQYQPLSTPKRPHTAANRNLAPDDGREQSLAIRERRVMWLLYFNTALLVISACFMLAPWPTSQPSKHNCAKLLSPTSPLLDSLEFWEGDFINDFNHSTKYRGPPSKDLEYAWLRLWDQPPIGVDEAIVAGLNKTEDKHYEIIGSDPNSPTYAASVEVFHQLRCLNLLRQATWPLSAFNETWNDRAYPYDFTEPISRRLHIDHCVETIRLSLMCYGDVTPVLFHDTPRDGMPRIPDLNVHQKCRNFDKIVDFVRENRVEVEDLHDGVF